MQAVHLTALQLADRGERLAAAQVPEELCGPTGTTEFELGTATAHAKPTQWKNRWWLMVRNVDAKILQSHSDDTSLPVTGAPR